MSFTTNEFLGLKFIDLSSTDTVNSSGATDYARITPPDGQIYQIKDIQYYAADPSGSGSGTHKVLIYHEATVCQYELYHKLIEVLGNSGTNIGIGYGGGIGILAGTTKLPDSDEESYSVINGGIWFNNNNPVDIKYTNSTDVNQTEKRTCNVVVAVYKGESL